MKRLVLSQNTLIPISLLMTLLGGAYKFAEVSLATEENRDDVAEVSQSLKEMQKNVMVTLQDQGANVAEMRTQLLLMDAKLNSMAEQLKSIRRDGRLRRGDD